MPLLEGLDGVNKMSKSLNNYIGITEQPDVMFRKVMQISDELMWRYYELLTDRTAAEIDAMKRRAAAGELNPMDAKMELGGMIVRDFHSAADAQRAREEFTRVVRRGEAPADVMDQAVPEDAVIGKTPSPEGITLVVRMDRLLAKLGLAESASDASRKRNEGAVSIDEVRVKDPTYSLATGKHIIRVGKKWASVTVPKE